MSISDKDFQETHMDFEATKSTFIYIKMGLKNIFCYKFQIVCMSKIMDEK